MSAFDGAYRKGREAFLACKPISACPYEDKRAPWHNMVTFSRGFIRAWEDGWNDELKKLSDCPKSFSGHDILRRGDKCRNCLETVG